MGLEVGILSVSWSIDLYLLLQAYDECKSCKDYIKECMLAPGDISFFKSTDVYTNLDNNTWKIIRLIDCIIIQNFVNLFWYTNILMIK